VRLKAALQEQIEPGSGNISNGRAPPKIIITALGKWLTVDLQVARMPLEYSGVSSRPKHGDLSFSSSDGNYYQD
jgi:hypothetical protein